MKKSDLKDGMVVELRKGTRLMLINDYLHNEMHEYNFNNYNEYLIHHRNVNILDIVKVYIIDISNIKEMFKSIKLKDMLADEFLKLIWEREKEVDWSKVPVDTKVLVSFDGENWKKRYFAKYEKGKFYVYGGGSNSWSNNGSLFDFDYCKLAEEPKEEITYKEVLNEFDNYCEEYYKKNKSCVDCKYKNDAYCIKSKFIDDRFTITRKENK